MMMRRLATTSLLLSGWRVDRTVPAERKFVCLGVPHTSNWDGALLLAVGRALALPMAWMIKDDWVRGPMGILLRRLGAVAIDRSRATGVVDQMIAELDRRDELALVIPPEATRSRADYWKSGFYHIALGAKVPVVPGYLDYARKRAGLGPAIHLTGDVRADMDRIRDFYRAGGFAGRVPGNVGPMRLREEQDPEHARRAPGDRPVRPG